MRLTIFAAKAIAVGFLFGAVLVSGCDKSERTRQYTNPSNIEVKPDDRFSVNRVQVVYDELAYNSKRGIYVITDKKTGKEFLGVSGIGVAELSGARAGAAFTTKEQ